MKNKDFKIITQNITYLDTAAAALKPLPVIKAIEKFYKYYPLNPASSASNLGKKVVSLVSKTRELCAKLIDASPEEVIFTSGTTQSLNNIARMLEPLVKKGDEILISPFNHAANYIVWLELAKRTGAKIVEKMDIISNINDKTKIVAFAQQNNSYQYDVDIKKAYQKAQKHNCYLVNDAAQAITHQKVSLNYADVVVFSGNKLYGPTGTGVLAVRKNLLKKLSPVNFGGQSNIFFNKNEWEPKKDVKKFESGTLNTAGIVGLGAAVKYFNEHSNFEREHEIAIYTYEELSKIPGMKIYTKKGSPIILFNYKNFHPHDITSYLGRKNIILRGGLHCVKAISCKQQYRSSVRVSIGLYNTKEDIKKMVRALKSGGQFLDV